MASQISLVEVTITRYQEGDKEYLEYFDNQVELSFPNWKESVIKIDRNVHHFFIDEDAVFTQDCYCFQFRPIGQSNDRDFCGGLEWVMLERGLEEVFEDWLGFLIQIFKDVISEYESIGYVGLSRDSIANNMNGVKFVTAWTYDDYINYYGDHDSEWMLLGRVDMGKIKEILVKRKET